METFLTFMQRVFELIGIAVGAIIGVFVICVALLVMAAFLVVAPLIHREEKRSEDDDEYPRQT